MPTTKTTADVAPPERIDATDCRRDYLIEEVVSFAEGPANEVYRNIQVRT